MKQITICITNKNQYRFFSNIPLIYRYKDIKFVFHTDPSIFIDNNSLIANFDYLIQLLTPISNCLIGALDPSKTLDLTIVPKYIQSLRLQAIINECNDLDIIIPKIYCNPEDQCTLNFSNITNLSSKLVIKRSYGSRGNDQILVDSEQADDFLSFLRGLTIEQLEQKFTTAIFTNPHSDDPDFDLEKSKKEKFCTTDNILIQEYISNIEQEFRIIVSGKQIWIYERSIKPGAYRQANMNIFDEVSTSQFVGYRSDECIRLLGEQQHKQLLIFINKLNLIIGSIDVFKTSDGQLGILEYSYEFGMQGFSNQMRKDVLESFLDIFVSKDKVESIS